MHTVLSTGNNGAAAAVLDKLCDSTILIIFSWIMFSKNTCHIKIIYNKIGTAVYWHMQTYMEIQHKNRSVHNTNQSVFGLNIFIL